MQGWTCLLLIRSAEYILRYSFQGESAVAPQRTPPTPPSKTQTNPSSCRGDTLGCLGMQLGEAEVAAHSMKHWLK